IVPVAAIFEQLVDTHAAFPVSLDGTAPRRETFERARMRIRDGFSAGWLDHLIRKGAKAPLRDRPRVHRAPRSGSRVARMGKQGFAGGPALYVHRGKGRAWEVPLAANLQASDRHFVAQPERHGPNDANI